MVVGMPFEMLKTTQSFQYFEGISASQSNPAFRIHLSALEDLDADVFYDAMPKGTWADGEHICFANLDRLFYGMHEIYQRQPPSERKSKIMRAMQIIENIISTNDITTDLTDMLANMNIDGVHESSDSVAGLFGSMTLAGSSASSA